MGLPHGAVIAVGTLFFLSLALREHAVIRLLHNGSLTDGVLLFSSTAPLPGPCDHGYSCVYS